jgi:hypothetical protein
MQLSVPVVAMNGAVVSWSGHGGDIRLRCEGQLHGADQPGYGNSSSRASWQREEKWLIRLPKSYRIFTSSASCADLSMAPAKGCFQMKNLITDIERAGGYG